MSQRPSTVFADRQLLARVGLALVLTSVRHCATVAPAVHAHA